LGNGNSNTGKKMLSELSKRLGTLNSDQLKLFVEGDLVTQRQLAFLSVCKTYGFIRDFAIEVLREKVLVFDYFLTQGEYTSYFNRKLELHDEIGALSENTVYKVRQVTFKVLEQAGIIDSIRTKVIQPQLIDEKLIKAISSDDRQLLKVLFMSDMDIENIRD
jgi:hypothetical protein